MAKCGLALIWGLYAGIIMNSLHGPCMSSSCSWGRYARDHWKGIPASISSMSRRPIQDPRAVQTEEIIREMSGESIGNSKNHSI